MSLILAVIFIVISHVIESTRSSYPLNELNQITIPGIEGGVISIVRVITLVISGIFLIRALADAMVLLDILTDIFIKRLGIKETVSPKRATRDLIYIIIIILVMATVTLMTRFLEAEVGSWLSIGVTYIGLGLIIVLIYDMGRIFYRIIEQRAEALADRISKIADQDGGGD